MARITYERAVENFTAALTNAGGSMTYPELLEALPAEERRETAQYYLAAKNNGVLSARVVGGGPNGPEHIISLNGGN